MNKSADILGAGRNALKRRRHAIRREIAALKAEDQAITAELARRESVLHLWRVTRMPARLNP